MKKILIGEQQTDKLNNRLKTLSKNDFSKYISELEKAPNIQIFFERYIKHSGISKAEIVNNSGLSRSYAYEILNGVKTNPSRDHLIALCLAAHMNIKITQYALKIGGMGELYAKVPRDAAIILHINQEKWSVVDLNIFLEENDLEIL